MTHDQQNELYTQYLAGSTQARDRLLSMCERDLRGMVKRLHVKPRDIDDCLQEARMTILAYALPKYQTHRGLQWRFYAALWARASMQRWLKVSVSVVTYHQKRTVADESLDVPRVSGRGWHESVTESRLDNMASEEPTPEESRVALDEMRVVRKAVEHVIQRLKRRQSKRFCRATLASDIAYNRLLALAPQTLDQVACRYGVARETVRKMEEAMMRLISSFLMRHTVFAAS